MRLQGAGSPKMSHEITHSLKRKATPSGSSPENSHVRLKPVQRLVGSVSASIRRVGSKEEGSEFTDGGGAHMVNAETNIAEEDLDVKFPRERITQGTSATQLRPIPLEISGRASTLVSAMGSTKAFMNMSTRNLLQMAEEAVAAKPKRRPKTAAGPSRRMAYGTNRLVKQNDYFVQQRYIANMRLLKTVPKAPM